jgi:hypothetical protein
MPAGAIVDTEPPQTRKLLPNDGGSRVPFLPVKGTTCFTLSLDPLIGIFVDIRKRCDRSSYRVHAQARPNGPPGGLAGLSTTRKTAPPAMSLGLSIVFVTASTVSALKSGKASGPGAAIRVAKSRSGDLRQSRTQLI